MRVGEGTVLHPIFGVETGFISNVFYENGNTEPVEPAGVLRLLGQIGAGSLPASRLTAPQALELTATGDEAKDVRNRGDFQYRADLRLAYDLMLSGDGTVNDTGGLSIGATIRGLVNPQGTWAFGFSDDFRRMVRAANFETDANTNRDINQLGLRLHFQPQGRSLSGFLRYDNTIDIFEKDTQSFANRIQHTFGVRAAWQPFPLTRVFVDGSMGVFGGLGADADVKVDSYPLTTIAGIQTLFTPKLTLAAHAGYTNGFYSSGPSYSAPVFGADVGFRYSPFGRALLGYQYTHQDSVNANFFRDHVVRFWLQQMFVPFVFTVQPELHFRKYAGVIVAGSTPDRNDVIFNVTTGVHYNFRNWIAATLDYKLTIARTDFVYMIDGEVDDPSFTRHELFLGVRAAL